MLKVIFHHYAAVEDLFDCATARPEPCLFFCVKNCDTLGFEHKHDFPIYIRFYL